MDTHCLPWLDFDTLKRWASEAAQQPPCAACARLLQPGWESLAPADQAVHLQACGTLRPNPDSDPDSEASLSEYHPAGTRYGSPGAPIAPGWFPDNRCELWRCSSCAQAFLRYTEYGSYYQEARIRALQASLLVDAGVAAG